MPTITTSGRKGREEMELALERAKAKAHEIVEAEKNAMALGRHPVAAASAAKARPRKNSADTALRAA